MLIIPNARNVPDKKRIFVVVRLLSKDTLMVNINVVAQYTKLPMHNKI